MLDEKNTIERIFEDNLFDNDDIRITWHELLKIK